MEHIRFMLEKELHTEEHQEQRDRSIDPSTEKGKIRKARRNSNTSEI